MSISPVIIGIDPGPTESAFAVVNSQRVPKHAAVMSNIAFIPMLTILASDGICTGVAVESIQSYGMLVGRSVFETCYMIGRIQQICEDIGIPVFLYPRPEYARAIAGGSKITDAILRQALILRFGGDKKGEPLNVLKGHTDKRSAFAVAVYHLDICESK